MSELNLKKEVKAEAIVQTSIGELRMVDASVYISHNDEKDITILIQDPNNQHNKIQISFTKK